MGDAVVEMVVGSDHGGSWQPLTVSCQICTGKKDLDIGQRPT